MTMARAMSGDSAVRPKERRAPPTRGWLTGVLVAIGVIFVFDLAFAIVSSSRADATSRVVSSNALRSIELVSQLDRVLERKRILPDDLILQPDPAERDRIAARIGQIDLQARSLRAAYAPVATLPHEAETWQRFRTALSRFDAEADGETCSSATVMAKIREDFVERFDAAATLQQRVEAAHLQGSEGLLRQALWNIVENSVKYRREDVRPEIELVGRVVGPRSYELRITDNGMGMSADEVELVFAPFYRAPRAGAVDGTGLGLSIVKRIIEAKGGTVAVESQLDRGSTFTLRLPLAGPGLGRT